MRHVDPVRLGRILLAWALLAAAMPGRSEAQLTDADRERLVAQIEVDAAQLDAKLLPDLVGAQETVVSRIDAIRQYLDSAADGPNRQAWLDYLDLEPLAESIESEQSPVIQGRAAVDLRFRLIGTAEGLELKEFRALRDSVESLIDAIVFRDAERSIKLVSDRLGSLSERIDELAESPTASEMAAITAIIRVLRSSGQAEGTVVALRDTFHHPNTALLVSESLLQQIIDRDVERTNPVTDCILGTRIVGNATTIGFLTSELLPSRDGAKLKVGMQGEVSSHSTGYNGPVRLGMVGNGNVTLSRVATLRHDRILLGPTSVQSQLQTQVTSVRHPLRLVRNIARKRVARDKSRANRIAAAHFRERIGEQFTDQTDEAANLQPGGPVTGGQRMLQRLSLREPTQSWTSTEDEMFIDATFRRDDQLAAVAPRPELRQAYALGIQLHESVIDNMLSPVLAGRTMNESKIEELLAVVGLEPEVATTDESTPELPEGDGADSSKGDELEPNEGEESEPPFEIDFARLQPVVFEARDQSVRIGVRGTRFAQGRRELERSMEITATYHPDTSADGKTVLRREEEINVDFPGGKRLTVAQAGLRPTIKRKFDSVFPRELLNRPMEVPDDVSIKRLRGRLFVPIAVEAESGWLTIAVE